MPRSHGNLRSVACNLSRGRLPGRLSAGIALLASALGASLVSAPAQEVRIIKPGFMAVTGFSGTTIPGQGQFGEENGGSPGAIWKVDGLTGAVSLFTTIAELRVPNRQPGQPALRITKTCEQGIAPGAPVPCRITVVNAGTASPAGPVRVDDVATVLGTDTAIQILTVTPDGAEWTCGAAPGDALSCQISGAVMTPGTSRCFDVTVQSPTHARFENCARGSWGPAPGNDIVYPFGEACAEGGSVPSPVHVEKTGDRECRVGWPCSFEITITNGGASAFSGPVRIGDAIGVDGTRLEGVAITEISPPFGCSPEPTALPMSCVATPTLGPGESSVHRMTVIIPAGGPLARIAEPLSAENCVGVVPPGAPVANAERIKSTAPGTGGRPGTRPYACHAFTIADRVEACAPGFVMNDAGRCVCPEGTTFRNGQCRKAGGEPPPVPPVKECKLLPGQIRLGDGRCVCPRGTSLIRGACRKEQADRCPRGTIGTPPNCRRLQISPDLQRLIAPTQRRRQPASRFFASGDAQYCAHYSLDIYVWNA